MGGRIFNTYHAIEIFSIIASSRPVPIMLENLLIILLRISQNFLLLAILLCLAYYSQVILRRYTGIRSTSFKIAESNEVKSLALAANFKQGMI